MTACNKTQLPPVHVVSGVVFTDDQFECRGKPAKPVKVIVDGKAKYKDSDTGRFINGLALRGDDCETKLHGVRDSYHRQIKNIEGEKKIGDGIDSVSPSN